MWLAHLKAFNRSRHCAFMRHFLQNQASVLCYTELFVFCVVMAGAIVSTLLQSTNAGSCA